MLFKRKDPDSVTDYQIDWSQWLGSETLSQAQWIVPTGINLVSSSVAGALATARISGGTAGQRYTLTCRATSSTGRVQDQSIKIICEEL